MIEVKKRQKKKLKMNKVAIRTKKKRRLPSKRNSCSRKCLRKMMHGKTILEEH